MLRLETLCRHNKLTLSAYSFKAQKSIRQELWEELKKGILLHGIVWYGNISTTIKYIIGKNFNILEMDFLLNSMLIFLF